MKVKFSLLFLFTSFLTGFIPMLAYAGVQDPAARVRIDAGLVLLVVAGIAYGVKTAYDNRRKSTSVKEIEK